MNDHEASTQIQRMVDFIEQEAQEKAEEIMTKANEDFNIEKLRLVEIGKEKFREKFEQNVKQIDAKKRIDYSTQLNRSRMEKLKAKENCVTGARKMALEQISKLPNDPQRYAKVLAGLILEGALRLNEDRMIVRCRKVDVGIVQSVISKVVPKAKKLGLDVQINVDQSFYLPPPPSAELPMDLACPGGVVLMSGDTKISLDDRLDTRLNICFEKLMPEIRKGLFSG